MPSVSVFAIFSVFFRIGLFSFGGGLTGWVYRDVVVLRGWIDEEEFLSGLAVSQILPGANIANLAVYVGQRLAGPFGSIVALAGLLAGPFLAVIALAGAYGAIRDLPLAQAALDGVAASAIGLLLLVVWKGGRRAAHRAENLIAFAVTFITVGLLHWSLLAVVVVVGPLSVAASWLRQDSHAE